MEVEELPGNETGLRTHTVFAHVLSKNAELYRAILGVFVKSREQFITHLRPAEVALSVRILLESADVDVAKLHTQLLTLTDLLLDLLGEALAIRTDPREPVDAVSMDGALIIRLGPSDPTAPLAEIVTTTGILRGQDCEVTISHAQYALEIEPRELALLQES